MYIFFNLGDWKTFDYGGPAWLPPGVPAAKIPNRRCSFSACVTFRGTLGSRGSSPTQWRKLWQAVAESIHIKMARLAESRCRLYSRETDGFPLWQGLTAEEKLRIVYGGTGESGIDRNRDGLIFYFMSLHIPRGRGASLTQALPLSSLPHLSSPFPS